MSPVPVGALWADQVAPPLVVAMIRGSHVSPGPAPAVPTAQQSDVFAHEMAPRSAPAGSTFSSAQVLPPSLDFRTMAGPVARAKHTLAVGQLTPAMASSGEENSWASAHVGAGLAVASEGAVTSPTPMATASPILKIRLSL